MGPGLTLVSPTLQQDVPGEQPQGHQYGRHRVYQSTLVRRNRRTSVGLEGVEGGLLSRLQVLNGGGLVECVRGPGIRDVKNHPRDCGYSHPNHQEDDSTARHSGSEECLIALKRSLRPTLHLQTFTVELLALFRNGTYR